MLKLIFVIGAVAPILYVAYFILAVRWRFQHEKRDKVQKPREDIK